MMECWKIGSSIKMISFLLHQFQPSKNQIIYYAIFFETNFPLFQHSNIPFGAEPHNLFLTLDPIHFTKTDKIT